MHIKSLIISAILLFVSTISFGQDYAKGYYKDIFMDGGVRLTSKKDLPVARYLDLSIEKVLSAATKDLTNLDTLNQSMMIAGSSLDENGILLYPDGEPRFRMIYVNGGLATQHGRSLGEEGREAIRKFIANGGSYVGSCAGAFLVGRYCDEVEPQIRKEYLDIWTGGYGITTGISDSYTGMLVPDDSPLLNYYDFGGDHFIDSVYHNNGCYACNDGRAPEGTEILLRYVADTFKLNPPVHMEASCWAYKKDDRSGRVIAMGSHPESKCTDERLDLMASLVKYAMEGNGSPSIKGVLKNGETRTMKLMTHDGNPDFTCIGDRQYHHFCIDIPEGVAEVVISLGHLVGRDNYDMHLFARYGGLAFMDNADYRNIALGFDKAILIRRPKAGKLYLSVFCATTVDTKETFYGTQYTGRTDVLNGVPYTITVNY
jgi:Uncharacterized conserved protein